MSEPVVGEARTAANPLIVHEAAYAHPLYLRGLMWRVRTAYFDREWQQVERLFEAEIEEMEKRRPALPAPQEPVQTAKRCPGCGWPVADVPSGDTALPELPPLQINADDESATLDLPGYPKDCAPLSWFLCRERQLLDYKTKYEAAQQEIAKLERTVRSRTEWANCGGVPSGKICRYDPTDEHEIYGGGCIEGDQHICELHMLRRLEAKYEAAHQALPWLPQPDSEGWWWRKFGPELVPLEVKSMLGADDELRALYVPSLGNYADGCGGQWQKVVEPSETKKEEA